MGPIFQNIAYLEDIHVHHLYFACNFNMIDALIFLIDFLLAHLTQRVMWGIAITWRPSSIR
jgi:hypothetical protein